MIRSVSALINSDKRIVSARSSYNRISKALLAMSLLRLSDVELGIIEARKL
jgi:hypothetical protein